MTVPVVLVSGATSAMGKAIVQRLAFAGYKVAVADQCGAATSKVASENNKVRYLLEISGGRVGGEVLAFTVDITKSDYRKELVDRVGEELGGLDALIVVPQKNNVQGDIIDTTTIQFETVFDNLLTIPFRLTQAALPLLKKSKNGSVVYLSSCLGFAPGIDVGLLSVASSSVLALTKAVAQSAAKQNVRVNAVCTGMVEGDGSGALWDVPRGGKEIQQSLQSMIPLGRLGRPSDAASLVEFLISEKARYISGENCLLNGGVSFRL